MFSKDPYRCLEKNGFLYEYPDITQAEKTFQEVTIEENGKKLAVRTECADVCGKVFQAVGVAVPPTIREI